MSAPRTPAEMADTLQSIAVGLAVFGQSHPVLFEIAAYLSRQPTDAQKIEALHHAMLAGVSANHAMLDYYCMTGDPDSAGAAATISARETNKALRLLGLPTE